jgi:hypothetical protein
MFSLMRALLTAALLSGAACSVYDPNPYANPALDSDGSVATGDACVADKEICNGKDDDCDGTSDEEEAVRPECESVLHGPSTCASGFCVRRPGMCHEGYYNCDGLPENGCESECPCGTDCDEDAGALP